MENEFECIIVGRGVMVCHFAEKFVKSLFCDLKNLYFPRVRAQLLELLTSYKYILSYYVTPVFAW